MNRKWFPHIIAVGAFVIFIILGFASASAPPSQWKNVKYNGEESKVLGETSWYLFLDENPWWTWRINNFETFEFHTDGSLQSSYQNTTIGPMTGQPINTTRSLKGSSWERTGQSIKFILENGFYYGEGTHDPDTNIISGKLLDGDGNETSFSMEYLGALGIRQSNVQSDFRTTGNSWTERGQHIMAGNRMIAFTSITGYSGNATIIRIPSIINRALVTSIGSGAFSNKQITSVTIPHHLNAGRNDNIDNQRIINIVSGKDAPDVDAYMGISTIGDRAFANNPITRIVICSDVRISVNAFDNMFVQFYENNQRKAGIYTFNNGQWAVEFR